ncbi:hypothetical protein ACIHDR_03550 [Nocardia sp. NPDC052278]|uniref:hypothetical protein n=1 Tax=unclassified Nocardia TaxID=2637762 RepID=UPI00367A64FD
MDKVAFVALEVEWQVCDQFVFGMPGGVDPDQPPVLQDNGNWKFNGTRNGVQIEVIVAPDGSVVTGYPSAVMGSQERRECQPDQIG